MSGAVFDGFFRRQTIDGKTTQRVATLVVLSWPAAFYHTRAWSSYLFDLSSIGLLGIFLIHRRSCQ